MILNIETLTEIETKTKTIGTLVSMSRPRQKLGFSESQYQDQYSRSLGLNVATETKARNVVESQC